MNGNDQNGRINVSEDKLRAVLAEFELRFFKSLNEQFGEQFERKADLIMLNEARKDIAGLEERVSALEKWRYGLAMLATVALVVAGYVAQSAHF